MREILEKEKLIRTVRRISHEIIERNESLQDVIFLGIKNNGVPLAMMIQDNIESFEHIQIPLVQFDITPFRDDVKTNKNAELPKIDLTGKVVVIIDDVLFTGRTVRAAMDGIISLGRPSKIQLAVLIDRGHRELPIRADYVGKNVPTSLNELVKVRFTDEIGVFIIEKENK